MALGNTVHIIWDGAEMERIMRSKDGPVARYMMTRAEVVKRAAKIQANKKTGKMANSIVKRMMPSDTGISITIIAMAPYSIFVHNGTKPHVIVAKNKPYLVFFWPNGPTGAHVYRMKQVNHPGYKGNHFLTDNLPRFFR